MKKTLLKNKILTFSALAFLLGVFNGQAQNLWTGATDGVFMTASNWTTAPLFDGSDNLRIATATSPITLNNSAAATPLISVQQFQTSVATEVTVASDITSTSTSLSVYIGGKLHITTGTFWGKGNIYFGNSTGELPYCNIETGGTLKTKSSILVGRNGPCTIDINGGTLTGESTGAIAIGNYFAAGAGIINLNSGLIKLFKVSGFAVGPFGTCNVNGGTLEEPAGDLVVKGTLNVNGGLVNLLAGASTINTAATAGTINLNSGTIKIAGALSAVNTVINVDAGSLVLTGDQTVAMGNFITGGKIVLSAAAITAGKTLLNTYDSVADLTTIKASAALGVGEFVTDNNLSIFPNPSVDGKFTISFPNGFEGAALSIHNVLGQVIYKTTIGTGSSYDVSPNKTLTSGIYFLQLQKDGKSITKKLVVR